MSNREQVNSILYKNCHYIYNSMKNGIKGSILVLYCISYPEYCTVLISMHNNKQTALNASPNKLMALTLRIYEVLT